MFQNKQNTNKQNTNTTVDNNDIYSTHDRETVVAFYRSIWKSIHDISRNTLLSHSEMLCQIRALIDSLPNRCECRPNGHYIINSLLNNNDNNFERYNIPNGTYKFFVHVHNTVNLKLKKPIYILPREND